MNILGHIRVARGVADDPLVWLGAALPDLQREAGVAIGDSHAWPEPVRVGIECHRAADRVFHDLPVFLDQSRALTGALLDRELPRGAARAAGHAGWELLFDGALVDDAALIDAYMATMALDVSAQGDQWCEALARRVARGAPRFYADPTAVAELLWRVLSRRRLLAFDRSQLPAVAAALAEARPTIVESVDEVFAAVIAELWR